MFHAFYDRHFRGPAGINAMIPIALPMVVSQASDTCMMFVDRLFLSRLSGAHLAASMGGGMTAFMMVTFFSGLLGYVNALVAQYYGAGRPEKCAVAAAQGIFVAVAAAPLLLLTIPLGKAIFATFAHDLQLQQLETEYFVILMFGAGLGLLRVVLSSFFSGIGKATVVMVANILAMVINIPANYVLVFGHFGCPALGMPGAAIGTLIGSACGTAILLAVYFGPVNRRRYNTWNALHINAEMLKTFLHFGAPAGLEFLLNMAAFNTCLQVFHSFGRQVAAAITITFNWDMVSFVPLIGVNIATMSLVGRHMGAGRPDYAEQAAYSGMKVAYLFTAVLTFLFLVTPRPLVAIFAGAADGTDYDQVVSMAVIMLRLAAIYLFSDATSLVFGGALRGAGDTRWVMRASVTLHWTMAGVGVITVKYLHWSPVQVWIGFVFMVCLIGTTFFLRFRAGHWKRIRVIAEPAPGIIPRAPGGPAPPEAL